MILQLPNGRIIEISVEQYLDMTDQDIQDLNSLGAAYTKDCVNLSQLHDSGRIPL